MLVGLPSRGGGGAAVVVVLFCHCCSTRMGASLLDTIPTILCSCVGMVF